MKLSIITLTYNNLKYTKKYIESLFKYTTDFELVIVDNGSADGTCEYIKSLPYKNIKTVFNTENVGFSKGNNQGIAIAEGEYIGFLNNDILLYPNWFEECENVFIQEKAAFVSPRQVNPHFDNISDYNYIDLYKTLKTYTKSYDKTFDDCSFSCVITKRDVINSIGLFDEQYSPAFFEDNDYKYRAIQNGYDVFVSNTVCFFHYGSKTSETMNEGYERNKQYYFKKNRFAEYLSINADEGIKLKLMNKDFQKFPLNCIYEIYKIFAKIAKRLKRIINEIVI